MPEPRLGVVEGSSKPARVPITTIPGYELYNRPRPKVTYLIDKLIPAGCQFVLAGERRSWKSWFLTSMACCVATGAPYFDRFAVTTNVPGQGSVLFIQLEERIHQAQRKYQWILAGLGLHRDPRRIQDLLVEYVAGRAFALEDEGVMDDFRRIIDDLKPDLVLWDSLRRMLRGNSNEDDFAMRLVYNLSLLQEVWPSTHGVVAHMRKRSQYKELNAASERVRGSSAVPDQVDCYLAIERNKLEDFAVITQEKNRDGDEHPDFNVRMRIVDSEGWARPEWIGSVSRAHDETGEPSEAQLIVLHELREGTRIQADVIAALIGKGFTRDQARFAIRCLESAESVVVDRANSRQPRLGLRKPLAYVGDGEMLGIPQPPNVGTPYKDND